VPVDRACSLYLSFLQCYRLLITQSIKMKKKILSEQF
jgi:hypothetical protein